MINEKEFWNIIEKSKNDPFIDVNSIDILTDIFAIYRSKADNISEHCSFIKEIMLLLFNSYTDDGLDDFTNNCVLRGKDIYDAVINEDKQLLFQLIKENNYYMRGEFDNIFPNKYIFLMVDKKAKELTLNQKEKEQMLDKIMTNMDKWQEYTDKFYDLGYEKYNLI